MQYFNIRLIIFYFLFLDLREDIKTGVFVDGNVEEVIHCPEEALRVKFIITYNL